VKVSGLSERLLAVVLFRSLATEQESIKKKIDKLLIFFTFWENC
jgi:hypothetical protein